jgi:hypothetical protein
MPTMGTNSRGDNPMERFRLETEWLPWLPRTQPRRVWTPNGLHGGTSRDSDGTWKGSQVYETGKFRGGGQGRNRTADASLFRAARSITYRRVSGGFIDLRTFSLDSIWTPDAISIEVGLHSDSTFRGGWTPPDSSLTNLHFGSGSTLATRARAIEDDSKMPPLGRQTWVPL